MDIKTALTRALFSVLAKGFLDLGEIVAFRSEMTGGMLPILFRQFDGSGKLSACHSVKAVALKYRRCDVLSSKYLLKRTLHGRCTRTG
jgi:hypothetical protein